MIIRPKLRPKELNIFNDLFGGRLREIAPKLPKEEIEELKESARYAQKVYLVAHDTEDRQADAEAFWERIEKVFLMEMNETQREIVEENKVFVSMFEALFGNSFYFENAGNPRYFIASADMMPRNLNRRVELMAEIKDEDFKKALGKFLDITLKDNMKAWQLTGDTFTKVVKSDDEEAVNSQEYFMNNRLI